MNIAIRRDEFSPICITNLQKNRPSYISNLDRRIGRFVIAFPSSFNRRFTLAFLIFKHFLI